MTSTIEKPKEVKFEIVNDEAVELLKKTKLEEPAKHELQAAFGDMFAEAEKWKAEALKIVVTDGDQKEEMKRAREIRLALKNIRVKGEKERKKLKEDSLRRGKAIDGMANILKFLIVPVEEHLQEIEDFEKRLEEARRAKIGAERAAQLQEIDPEGWANPDQLAAMEDGVFQALLEGTKAKAEKAAAEAKAIEEARIAKEKAEAEERERVAKENEKLKAEMAAREKKEAAERKAREEAEAKAEAERQKAAAAIQAKLDAEAKAREEAEAKLRAERERQKEIEEAAIQAKAEALRAQEKAEQAALAAPDKDKLTAFANHLLELEMPTMKSVKARKIVTEFEAKLDTLENWLKAEIQKL